MRRRVNDRAPTESGPTDRPFRSCHAFAVRHVPYLRTTSFAAFPEPDTGQGYGGGYSAGGGYVIFSQCIFAADSAVRGGAIYAWKYGSVQLRNCLSGNTATDAGSGIFLDSGVDLSAARTIIVYGRGGAAVDGNLGQHSLSCCDVYGNEGETTSVPLPTRHPTR